MANKHIKVINGRKYYYASIRKGKKVTSKYLGPVERIRRKKSTATDGTDQLVTVVQGQEDETENIQEDENYIG